MKATRFLFFLIPVLGSQALAAEGDWIELFNGKDLTGWVPRGGKAKYAVEDSCIVGSTVLGTANSFLCTEKPYGNFVLELDFKVNPALNSGVQVRSECADQNKSLTGKDGQPLKNDGGQPIKVNTGRVYGYQCEIDMDMGRKRLWTAGLYDEGRRGWLFPGIRGGNAKAFSEQGAKVTKPDEWNHLRIEAVGPRIRTWLNGEPRADITDDLTPSGLIALQVHGVGNDKAKEGIQVRFRNIRLKEVSGGSASADAPEAMANTLTEKEKADGWRLLWDGKTTDGWRSARAESFPQKGWEIKDGALWVRASGGAESGGGGDIITRDRFSNFELKADFKITPGANSGIKYFVQSSPGAGTGTGARASTGSAIGCEYQVLDDERHPDAKLGRNGNRTVASLYDLIPAATTKKVNPIGEWNTARIVVLGRHVEHWLNGEKVLEYDRGSPEFREIVAQSKFKNTPGFGESPDGHILLQDHGNQVAFRNIKILTSPTPPTNTRALSN